MTTPRLNLEGPAQSSGTWKSLGRAARDRGSPPAPLPQPVAPETETEPKETGKTWPPDEDPPGASIESWIVRYPQPQDDDRVRQVRVDDRVRQVRDAGVRSRAEGERSSSGGMKYQLERARCIGNAWCCTFSDPDDPSRRRAALDILGSLMLIG